MISMRQGCLALSALLVGIEASLRFALEPYLRKIDRIERAERTYCGFIGGFFVPGSAVLLTSNADRLLEGLLVKDIWRCSGVLLASDGEDLDAFPGVRNYAIVEANPERLLAFFEGRNLKRRSRYVAMIVRATSVDILEATGAALRHAGYANVVFVTTTAVYGFDGFRIRTLDRETVSPKMVIVKGSTFTAAVMAISETAPYVFRERADDGNWRLHGVAANVVNVLAEKFELRLRILDEHPLGFGSEQPNGTWTGLLEYVKPGNGIDIAFGGIVPTKMCTTLMDYSRMFWWDVWVIAVEAPGIEISWKSVFLPLSAEVWLCSLLSIVAFAVLTRALHRMVESMEARGTSWGERPPKVMDVLKVMLGQSVEYPRGTGVRALFGMWLVFVYLMQTTYSGSLVGRLTALTYGRSPNNFQELRKTGMILGMTAGGRLILKDPEDALAYHFYRNSVVLKHNEFHTMLFERRMATQSLRSSALYFNWKHKGSSRRIHLSDSAIVGFPMMFYFPLDHPYLETFDRVLALMDAAGLVAKWSRDYGVAKDDNDDSKRGMVVLGLMHLAGVFVILLVGLGVATAAFAYELYEAKARTRRLR